MKNTNKKQQAKKKKTPFIKTRVKRDNSVEVEIQKSPDKTIIGKTALLIMILAMTLLGLVGLVILIIQVIDKM